MIEYRWIFFLMFIFLSLFRVQLVDRFFPFSVVHEKQLRTSEDFFWQIDSTLNGKFVIDVEFLDLKISPDNVRAFVNYFTFSPVA